MPRAKRVIYLFMGGAPSQLDMFDYKPTLAKYVDGHPVPAELVKNQQYAFIPRDAALFATTLKIFQTRPGCGAELSEALPHLGEVVDDIAIVKSMTTDAFNHAPAQIFMNTGATQFGRPSMGSWVTYGLGSESQSLPGFVVLSSAGGTSGGTSNWGCGFLPTVYQGVPFRRSGDPILSLSNPPGVTPQMQRESLDLIESLNQHHLNDVGDPEIATRINAFEMAYLDAKQRAGIDGHFQGIEGDTRNCAARNRGRVRSQTIVCLHGGWWSVGCGLCSFIMRRGITTARSSTA